MKGSAIRMAWVLMLPLMLPFGLVSSGMAGMASARARLRFINDNYSKAAAQAKQRKLPIFVEVWAPW